MLSALLNLFRIRLVNFLDLLKTNTGGVRDIFGMFDLSFFMLSGVVRDLAWVFFRECWMFFRWFLEKFFEFLEVSFCSIFLSFLWYCFNFFCSWAIEWVDFWFFFLKICLIRLVCCLFALLISFRYFVTFLLRDVCFIFICFVIFRIFCFRLFALSLILWKFRMLFGTSKLRLVFEFFRRMLRGRFRVFMLWRFIWKRYGRSVFRFEVRRITIVIEFVYI